jgi:hypothetical protein
MTGYGLQPHDGTLGTVKRRAPGEAGPAPRAMWIRMDSRTLLATSIEGHQPLIGRIATSDSWHGSTDGHPAETRIIIEKYPHVTFVPDDSSEDGILSSDDAFRHGRPRGSHPGRRARATWVISRSRPARTQTAAHATSTTTNWCGASAFQGLSARRFGRLTGSCRGQCPSTSAATKAPSSQTAACRSTLWDFADAHSGNLVLGSRQMN